MNSTIQIVGLVALFFGGVNSAGGIQGKNLKISLYFLAGGLCLVAGGGLLTHFGINL